MILRIEEGRSLGVPHQVVNPPYSHSLKKAVELPNVLSAKNKPVSRTNPRTETMTNPFRGQVIRLYKTLLYLGRDYPQGFTYFRQRLKSAFMKNKDVTDHEKIKKLVARGDFVIKEIETLYFLRKYRAMKKRYYDTDK